MSDPTCSRSSLEGGASSAPTQSAPPPSQHSAKAVRVLDAACRATIKSIDDYRAGTDDALPSAEAVLTRILQGLETALSCVGTHTIHHDSSSSIGHDPIISPTVSTEGQAAADGPQSAESREDMDKGLVPAASVEKLIEAAVASRDEYWRERVQESLRGRMKRLEAELQQGFTSRCTRLRDEHSAETSRLKATINELTDLHEKAAAYVSSLEDRVAELEAELEGGRKIIDQFSRLMADKASAICQYCRRSGTLPPIPFK